MKILFRSRFHWQWSLVFFLSLAACSENEPDNSSVTIRWSAEKPTGIYIPKKVIGNIDEKDPIPSLAVHLKGNNVGILGEFQKLDEGIEFIPVIPFTRGLRYELYYENKLVAEFTIPGSDVSDTPAVLAVYPSADTLPENLLKFYIQFSRPMQEGEALQHIRLVKNNRDTLGSVFLDLQPELWNQEGTILTLWLDPGRIKRGLQPNLLLGPPLQSKEHYRLLVGGNWQDAQGQVLKQDFQKDFVTDVRDSISPDPETWKIAIPVAGTQDQLQLIFPEALDYILLKNTLRVVDRNQNELNGSFQPGPDERSISFIPASPWKTGEYLLEIQSRLEDLAGNNLNLLFDTDVEQQKAKAKKIYKRVFTVK